MTVNTFSYETLVEKAKVTLLSLFLSLSHSLSLILSLALSLSLSLILSDSLILSLTLLLHCDSHSLNHCASVDLFSITDCLDQ